MSSHNRSRHIATCIALAMLTLPLRAQAEDEPPRKGDPFPDLELKDLRTEKPIELIKLRGKVILIDFWATWSSESREATPKIKELYKQHHEDGLEIIGISLDYNKSKARVYIQRENLAWHHVADGAGWTGTLAKKFEVEELPRFLLVDKYGKLLELNVELDKLDERVTKALEQKWDGPTFEELGLKAASQLGAASNKAPPKTEQSQAERNAIAEQHCSKWLKIARRFTESENYSLARRYYQKIIDAYPETDIGKTAKEELDKLPTDQ